VRSLFSGPDGIRALAPLHSGDLQYSAAEEIARYLKLAKIDYEPPARAPPRFRQEEILDFAAETFEDAL